MRTPRTNPRATALKRLHAEAKKAAAELEKFERPGHRRRVITGSPAQVISMLLGYEGMADCWRVCIEPMARMPVQKALKKSRQAKLEAQGGTGGEVVVIIDPNCVGVGP